MSEEIEQIDDGDCFSCLNHIPKNECPKSKNECGHHCNHSWKRDECCWCGRTWDMSDETDIRGIPQK